MNVLDIPVLTEQGDIPLTALGGTSACHILAPRSDLRCAHFQLLVCLFQTLMPPETEDDWADRWASPPAPDDITRAFEPHRTAFEMDTDGPAFLQDLDADFEGNEQPIEMMFLEGPTAGHFVKIGQFDALSPRWAALALFILQSNSPAGGRGTRTGIRGGGPLTTLLLPGDADTTLWRQVWANVLSRERLPRIGNADQPRFPWMAATRTSDKEGAATLPIDVHPLHVFWGMPRRIRLRSEPADGRCCALSGDAAASLVTGYKTRHGGFNYEGDWIHPHSAYFLSEKQEQPPLSLKGQPGAITYRHWSGLCLSQSSKAKAADVVLTAYDRDELRHGDLRLWVSGYDMDNAKARCWYESTMPVFVDLDGAQRKLVDAFAADLVDAATHIGKTLRNAVKNAWFSDKAKIKANAAVLAAAETSFLARTERPFFTILHRYIADIGDEDLRFSLRDEWRQLIVREGMNLFDEVALNGEANSVNFKRVMVVRQQTRRFMYGGKAVKTLKIPETEQ